MNKWLLTAGLIGTASQAIAAVDTVAPTVSRTPAPGTYSVAQSVKLAIKDNTDAKPNLYYTTDGSLPGVHSKLYRGEVINVTDSNSNTADYDLKIRTLAMDINGNMARNNFYYRVNSDDKVAPKVNATPVAGTYTSAQKIVLKVTDDKDKAPKIYYTLDGKTPTTKSVVYVPGQVLNAVDTVTGTGFDLRIRTLAVDASGNQAFRNFGYVINSTTSDVTAPEVAVSPLPGKFTAKQSVTLQVSDSQDKAPKLYYTLDGSAASTSSTLYTGPISVAETTVINTYAVDASGNKVTGKYSYEIGSETGVGDGYLLDQYVSPGIAIYVKSGWTKTNLHSFSVLPAGASADTKWPGNTMADIGSGWTSAIFPGATTVNMVFNNGAGTQYPTGMGKEMRTASGCLDIASKVWTTLADCTAPLQASLTSSVASGKFSDELEVTLSIMGADANATGYLTLDGVAPTASHGLLFKNGQKLKLGKNTAVGKEIKLWLSAEGKEAAYTYSKVEALPGVKVQIYAPDWSAANAHYFNVTPSTVTASVWPGVAMTADTSNKGWYSYTVPNAESASFVFNMNGDATKAKDLVASKGGCFTVTAGAVPTEIACPIPVASAAASPKGGDFNTDDVSVTLSLSGKDVASGCYTTDGKDPAVSCTNSFKNGDVVTLGNTLKIGDSVTLKLYAKNDLGVSNPSYTFTKKTPPTTGAFTWDNATVYFVLTDRFRNGDTSNDHSYGRECPKSAYDKMTGKVNTAQCYSGYEKREGNYRGGDLAGMLEKLNAGYFTDLGVNAIWLSVPFEQVHGFVGGENFKHYPYHGYYTQDFTNVDANIGDKALMKQFIDAAHAKNIRVIFDVVMNHVGYDTMADADEYGFAGLKAGWESYYYTANASTIHYTSYGTYLDYGSSNWTKWWGSDWVRSKAYGTCTASDDVSKCLDDLPDLKTESTSAVALPPLLVTKWTREGRLATEQASLDAFFQKSGLARTPSNYVIKWLTDWVREYGVDGFRCDTAKHVPLNVWKDLKTQANIALKEWQAKPGVIKPDEQDLPFWMTGEVWGHGVGRSAYFDNGFDSIINFTFQTAATSLSSAEGIYSSYSGSMHGTQRFNALSYISSHDTAIYNRSNLIDAGSLLLMVPGQAQIFYGDESARPKDDYAPHWNEPTRGFMNWCDGSLGSDVSVCTNKSVLAHWQKLGQFRNKHTAIGAGAHAKIADTPYTFSRVLGNDKVVVAFGASGQQSISVGSIFADGTAVVDAYTGTKATVTGGKVSLNAGGVVLLEKQ